MNTARPRKPQVPGRSWAITGFLLGSLVSIGGNVQAVWLPADDPNTPADWAPTIPSQVGAIVWPLALMVSVEVLSRIAWPDGMGWRAVRLLGIGAVAGGSAVISYGHIYAVLRAWGYGPLGAGVGPLVVDGLMLISGFALVSIGRSSRAAAVVVPQEVPTPPSRTSNKQPTASLDDVLSTMPATSREAATHQPTIPAQAPVRPPAVQQEQEAPVERERPATRQEARASRPAPSRPKEASTLPETQGTRAGNVRISTEEALERIREYRRENNGELPSPNWMKQKLGMGAQRAERLLANVNLPNSEIVELHTVGAATG